MSLDFSPFEKAIKNLQESIYELDKDRSNTFVKDSVIQRFKYTYELSHKMLKRFLTASEFSNQNSDEMVFANIIRTANEKGLLLSDVTKWNEYRTMRNITSHAYDSGKANDIITVIPEFLCEAEFLLKTMMEKSQNL